MLCVWQVIFLSFSLYYNFKKRGITLYYCKKRGTEVISTCPQNSFKVVCAAWLRAKPNMSCGICFKSSHNWKPHSYFKLPRNRESPPSLISSPQWLYWSYERERKAVIAPGEKREKLQSERKWSTVGLLRNDGFILILQLVLVCIQVMENVIQ